MLTAILLEKKLFRNPTRKPAGMVLKPCNGKNFPKLNWLAGFLLLNSSKLGVELN